MLALTLLLCSLPQVAPAIDRPARAVRHVPTLEGTPGSGRVGLFDALSGRFVPERLDASLAELDGIVTLPIEFVGRSEASTGLPDRPRLRFDAGQGARIELPRGGGSIYRVRATRAGALVFGLLQVDRSGRPRLLIERPAVAGIGDPFQDRVGIDSRGTALLLATTVVAGGDLFEIDLESGDLHERTAQLPPLEFGRDGLWLGAGWGFGVSSQGIVRFVRRPSAQGSLVPVAGAPPAGWRGDAAISPGGQAAVAIAGSGPDRWIPYLFGISGPCRPASITGAAISPAGYQPEVGFGPFLAVLDDGVTAAWRVELPGLPGSGGIRDVVIGRADLPGAPVVASGDPVILDTLNEIGRVIPGPVGEVLFAVGEPNDPAEGGLEASDIFAARVDAAGGLSIRNVSGTSGDLVAPFDPAVPLWTPAHLTLVSQELALVHDDDAKQLVALDLVAGTWTVVLSEVRDVAWIETSGAGGAWCAAVERDDAGRNWQVVGASSPESPAVVLDVGSASAMYLTPTAFRAAPGGTGVQEGAVAYVRRELGLEYLDVIDLATLQRIRWSATAGAFEPPLAFIGPRLLAFTRQAGAAGAEQRLWAFRGPALDRALQAPLRPTRLLR